MIIHIDLNTILIVISLTFFFKQIKKKGDDKHKLPWLGINFTINLTIGRSNRVNTKNDVNTK